MTYGFNNKADINIKKYLLGLDKTSATISYRNIDKFPYTEDELAIYMLDYIMSKDKLENINIRVINNDNNHFNEQNMKALDEMIC